MAKRFGRNQKRKLTSRVIAAEARALAVKAKADQAMRDADLKLAVALREHLANGRIPLVVEHFLSREGRQLIMRAMLDERRSNLHYQHSVSPRELQLQQDRDERERFGLYLGRAIADRLAEAYAGKAEGRSCA